MKTKFLSILGFLLLFFSVEAKAVMTCEFLTNPPQGTTQSIPLGSVITLFMNCTSTDPDAGFDFSWSVIGAPHTPRIWFAVTEPGILTVGAQAVELSEDCGPGGCVQHFEATFIVNTTSCTWGNGKADGVTCVDISTLGPDGSPINGDCPKCAVGQPVNVASGSLWHRNSDFFVKGRTEATSLRLDRMYLANSALPRGDFGPNWHHNYETQLKPDYSEMRGRPAVKAKIYSDLLEAGNILWIDEGGGPWRFRRQPDGTFVGPPNSNVKLTAFADHFELRKKDGTRLFFARSNLIPDVGEGKLYRIEESHGEAVTLSYLNGYLETVSSPFAGTIRFIRTFPNASVSSELPTVPEQNPLYGRVVQVIRERDNLVYSYAYNINGRLASATDFANNSYQYTYIDDENAGRAYQMLASITDPLGRTLQFTYYPNGKAYQQFEPGGGVRTFIYGDRKTAVKDIDGLTTQYFFDSNLDTVKVIFPDGTKQYSTYGESKLLDSFIELGGKTKFGYDQNGNLSSIQRPEDPVPAQIAYDQTFNKPILIQPIVGAPTEFTLNPSTGDLMRIARGGLSLVFTRDAFGNILATNNGRTTYSHQRDANGFLTQVFDSYNPETRSYDVRGRLISRNFLSGRVVFYTHDDYDRVLTVTDSHGPDVMNTYDAMGRLLQRRITDGETYQTTAYQYDDRDRLVAVTDPLNRTTTFAYHATIISDKPIAITDPAGRTTLFNYDRMHRLVEKTEANGATTKFTYDVRGNLTSVTDANGNSTVYAYDLNDRRIRESHVSAAGTQAVRQATEYFYDSADRLVRKITPSATRGAGRATLFEYDSLDRLIKRVVQREGSQNVIEEAATFSYEPQLDAKLLASATNNVSNLAFTHEIAPPFSGSSFSVNATQAGNPLGLIEGNFTITRGVTGEITSISDASGVLFTKNHDPAGKLVEVVAGNFNTMLSYDGFGRKTSVRHADGEMGVYAYDLLNRITSVNWTGPLAISEALTYDQAGNIVGIQRENGSFLLGYDQVGRLVSSVSSGQNGFVPYNRNFTYDFLGNRTNDSLNGAGNFVSNFLTGNGIANYQADPDGFGTLTKEVSGPIIKNYSYRTDGRLSAFQSMDIQTAYYYDALGRRVAKAISTPSESFTQTYLHVLEQDRILLAKSGNGTRTLYLDGNGVDQHLGEVKSGQAKGYVTDHLGSVLNSEPAGAQWRFGIFGEPYADPGISASSSAVMYGFTGREYDAESRLNYHRARYYDPNVGRWLSQDPIGIRGGLNLYAYVENKPLMEVDPLGLIGLITDPIPFIGPNIVGHDFKGCRPRQRRSSRGFVEVIQSQAHVNERKAEIEQEYGNSDAPDNTRSRQAYQEYQELQIQEEVNFEDQINNIKDVINPIYDYGNTA